MRDCLPLARVLHAVTSIEETTLDGDEGVIVLTLHTYKCIEIQ